MSLWSRIRETVNSALDALGIRGQGEKAEPAYTHETEQVSVDDTDPFTGFYVEPEEIQHERIEDWEAMTEWIDTHQLEDDTSVFGLAPEEVSPEDIRHVRYASAEEAMNFLIEAGIYGFSEVVYFEEEDLYGIAVGDSPGAGEG